MNSRADTTDFYTSRKTQGKKAWRRRRRRRCENSGMSLCIRLEAPGSRYRRRVLLEAATCCCAAVVETLGGLVFQRIAAAASLVVISFLLDKTFLHPFLQKGPHWSNTSDFHFHFYFISFYSILFYFLFLPMLNSSVFFQQILENFLLSPTIFFKIGIFFWTCQGTPLMLTLSRLIWGPGPGQ
jgi:hypothetical protein